MKVFIGLILIFGNATLAAASNYHDGDIIFQESQSHQSKAIREVTKSRWSHVGILFQEKNAWYVAEAVQPVRMTPLSSFISRGKNRDYRVYRMPGLTQGQGAELKKYVSRLMGQNYDIYFEWSDNMIYCSELVYKAFFEVTGAEIGTLQKYRDLNLNGPFARELIRRRIEDTGRVLNLDEPIVTPATQLQDSDLVLVEQAGP